MHKSIALLTFFLLLSPAFSFEVGDEPAVSVRSGDLRSSPGFLANITAPLDYGESVEIIEIRGDWLRIRVANSPDEGWLHISVVAEKESMRLEQADSSSTGSASSREIALAGRGFNEKVEAQYKSQKDLDFSLVDEMEEYGRSIEELVIFLADAGLTVEAGSVE